MLPSLLVATVIQPESELNPTGRIPNKMKLELVVVGLFFGTALCADWNYNLGQTGGPDDWVSISSICAQKTQSPINIDSGNLEYDPELTPFNFQNYGNTDGVTYNIGNTGHSVELLFDYAGDYSEAILSGGGLPNDFRLFQLHFHWGSESIKGSEHSLDDGFFPMEMHMVHANTQYKTAAEALVSKGGLAVLGFFFQISDNDNPAFGNIIDNLKHVQHKGDTQTINTFPLDSIMSDNLNHFYRYSGSLTTPNCYETVTWTVFNEPIYISERQMNEFRQIKEGEVGDPEHFISNNFRPIQSRNFRTVYTSDILQGQFVLTAASSKLQASVVSILLTSLLLIVV